MDAFISYRRDTGLDKARGIAEGLKDKEYTVFFDCDSILDGKFSTRIYKNIENSSNFILVLSKNCLNRCESEKDWVRLEIEHALKMGKNIIPVMCTDFSTPEDIVESISSIMRIQAVPYDAYNYKESISRIIDRLMDENGKKLFITKKNNIANTYYANVGLSDAEKKRITADHKVSRGVEEKVFRTFLEGRENVVVFNPAIYVSDLTFQRYDKQEQISQVYGMMNLAEDVELANKQLAEHKNYTGKIYTGNMEYDDFEDTMDRILSENGLNGFDVIDLTLILRDLSKPQEKLQQAVDRLNENGVVYIREIDHDMVLAYPDPQGLIDKMMEYIKNDKYSGDFFAGRKVYNMLKKAGIDKIYAENTMLSTVNMSTRDRMDLMETYFSYVIREYGSMYDSDPDDAYYSSAVEWIEMHYEELKEMFRHPDFYFLSGFLFFYGVLE